MSQWDKLISRIYGLSNDLQFEEIKKVLEHYGYRCTQRRRGSSHYTFRKANRYSITIPVHGTIKPVYVEMVRNAIEQEENR